MYPVPPIDPRTLPAGPELSGMVARVIGVEHGSLPEHHWFEEEGELPPGYGRTCIRCRFREGGTLTACESEAEPYSESEELFQRDVSSPLRVLMGQLPAALVGMRVLPPKAGMEPALWRAEVAGGPNRDELTVFAEGEGASKAEALCRMFLDLALWVRVCNPEPQA